MGSLFQLILKSTLIVDTFENYFSEFSQPCCIPRGSKIKSNFYNFDASLKFKKNTEAHTERSVRTRIVHNAMTAE